MILHKTRGEKVFDLFNGILLIILALLCILPFIHILALSFSSSAAATSGKVAFWPVDLSLNSYQYAFQNPAFLWAFGVTLVRVILGLAIDMAITIFAAYPLSKSNGQMPGRTIFAWIFVVTMFIGGGMIPTYLLVNDLGLLDTYWSVVLPGAINVFNMIIMRTSFQSLPVELNESAYIDGANDLQILWKVSLPLSKPIIATMVLFYAVAHWNGYVHAMLYFTDKNMYPIQLYVRSLVLSGLTEMTSLSMDLSTGADAYGVAQRSIQYGVIIAATLPILLIYPFISKYFEKGVMVGSLKG